MMKYLKKYKIFLESDEFEVEDTDTPDVKMSKEEMNKVGQHISEYKSKKPSIDTLYKNAKDDKEITDGLENILGKEDVPDRNPFLIEYSHISKLQRDIEISQKDNVNDKIKIDDFQTELRLSTDNETKASISSKITDINNRMSQRTVKINEIQKDLLESEKIHIEKMSKMESDMKEYIENISSSEEK